MTICEHCGKRLRATAWEEIGGSHGWYLRWEHDDDGAHDHDATPAPELPLEAQEGAPE